jgi:hypothetical protein
MTVSDVMMDQRTKNRKAKLKVEHIGRVPIRTPHQKPKLLLVVDSAIYTNLRSRVNLA